MPQQASSCSSTKSNAQAITDRHGVSQKSRADSKNLLEERVIDSPGRVAECELDLPCSRFGNPGIQRKLKTIPTANPCKRPKEGKPELSDLNWTSSPGAEEWEIGQTADGRAVYSTVNGVGAGVTVEFQKWDW